MDHVCTTMKSTNVYRLQERKYKARTAVRQHLSQQWTIRQQRQRKALERTKKRKSPSTTTMKQQQTDDGKRKRTVLERSGPTPKQRNIRRKRKNKKTGRQRQNTDKRTKQTKKKKKKRSSAAGVRRSTTNVHDERTRIKSGAALTWIRNATKQVKEKTYEVFNYLPLIPWRTVKNVTTQRQPQWSYTIETVPKAPNSRTAKQHQLKHRWSHNYNGTVQRWSYLVPPTGHNMEIKNGR